MKRRNYKCISSRSSNQTMILTAIEEEYLKAANIASQILSYGAGMVGISVPFSMYYKNMK